MDMDFRSELSRLSQERFAALILDNEVTVGHFVTSPPLPWTRLTRHDGIYRIAGGYPIPLTEGQTKIEMKIWDEVSLPEIISTLQKLEGPPDYFVIGNNAGQGLPLAHGLPQTFIGDRAAIIYGESLPEIEQYKDLGCRTFFFRSETAPRLLALAKSAGRPLSLFFINTIQHNESNYHDP